MPIAEIAGAPLHYESDGEGPAIVFAHGGEGTYLHWWQQVAFFRDRFRCVTYDARGFGLSPGPLRPPAGHADDLVALLDFLGIERAVVVGHSMGGWAASGASLRYSDRVRALVMSDTPFGFFTPALSRWAVDMMAKLRDGFDVIAACTPPYFAEESPGLAHLFEAMGRLNPPRTGPRGFSAYEEMRDTPPGDYSAFPVPALFLVGSDDAMTTPALIRATAAAVRGARMVELARCGHSGYFERAALFNAAVDSFLRAALAD